MSTTATVLGVDFGGSKVELRVDGAGGTTDARLDIRPGEPATSVLDRTFALAVDLVERAGGVRAVGVATPGVVFHDRVELAPNVVGWSDLALRDRMTEAFGIDDVVVENDVKAAAFAEAALGALRDADPGLYVNLGTGIAIAAVIGGRVLRGAHGAAGEIGYGVIGEDADWSGSAAPLEEHAGGGGLARRLAVREDIPATDAASLVVASVSSPAARAMWEDAIDVLSRHLLTAMLTIDPTRVAIGGGMVAAGAALLDPLRLRLRSATPYEVDVVPSDFGTGAALRGAVLLARHRLEGLPS